jgi:heme iron utilization protein
MDQTTANELRNLLTTRRVLTLAVLVDGRPYTGLLAYALQPDFSAVLIHASTLARHTAGLTEGAPFSVLIHAADDPAADPLQLPRFSAQGSVHVVERGSSAYDTAHANFIQRFPESEMMFDFGDFKLYELRFSEARFIPGFARAMDVTLADLRSFAL